MSQVLGRWRLHKKPRTYIYGGLWLLGLYLIFLAPAPQKLTDEALDRYEAILTEAEAYNRKNHPSLEVRLHLSDFLHLCCMCSPFVSMELYTSSGGLHLPHDILVTRDSRCLLDTHCNYMDIYIIFLTNP